MEKRGREKRRKEKDNAEAQSTQSQRRGRTENGKREEGTMNRAPTGASIVEFFVRRGGGGSRRSSGRWRGVRVGARCRLACRWRRSGRGRISARRGLVRLSLGSAIRGTASLCECRR